MMCIPPPGAGPPYPSWTTKVRGGGMLLYQTAVVWDHSGVSVGVWPNPRNSRPPLSFWIQ